MALGLRKGKVEIVSYDESWKEAFGREAMIISHALGGLVDGRVVIEHFGSTAVPSCEAKPIMDIAVVLPVEPAAVFTPHVVKALKGIGYGNEWIHVLPDRICFTKGKPVTHHLYLIQEHSWTLRAWILFRDVLCNNSELRQAYSTLKQRLAERHPRNRRAYTDGKTSFIKQVLASHSTDFA